MTRKRLILLIVLFLVLNIAGFLLFLQPRYTVPILMYHHIAEGGRFSSLRVSPDNFQRQMQFLARFNYNVVSLNEFVQAKLKAERLPRNTVVITLDDGYKDNYTVAFPLLQKYKLPATIFAIVESIGEEGYLSDEQITEMASSGIIAIGSHSLSGDYLPGREEKEIAREISLSKKILREKLKQEIELFAYPIGGFTPQIQELVQRYGYLAACTTNRGSEKSYLNNDLLALKRIKVKDSLGNLFVFWVKLSGYYNLWRQVRRPY